MTDTQTQPQKVEVAQKAPKVRKANSWVAHCRNYAKTNNCSYKHAMANARKTYKQPSKTAKPKKASKKVKKI